MAERACPGCGKDLTGAHWKRKWCSERCRKETLYSGTCESCGAKTDGSNGREAAPTHCKECAPRANRLWPKERIIKKIKEWAERYGEPPTSEDWNPSLVRWRGGHNATAISERFSAGEWPWAITVRTRFGSWNAGIAAAGFEPRPQNRDGAKRRTLPPLQPNKEAALAGSSSERSQ